MCWGDGSLVKQETDYAGKHNTGQSEIKTLGLILRWEWSIRLLVSAVTYLVYLCLRPTIVTLC